LLDDEKLNRQLEAANEQEAAANCCELRIPDEADQRSGVMSITIPG
jgi:hypothetical protein